MKDLDSSIATIATLAVVALILLSSALTLAGATSPKTNLSRSMVSISSFLGMSPSASTAAASNAAGASAGGTTTAAIASVHAVSSKVAKRLDTMKQAESALLEFAHRFGHPTISGVAVASSASNLTPSSPLAKLTLFDTPIPRRSLASLKPGCTWTLSGKQEPEHLVMHGVQVHPLTTASTATKSEQQLAIKGAQATDTDAPPLVLLHGYANGALYYYRNLVGLSQHFRQGVYSLDLLGWGLSSRPHFKLIDNSVEAAESFFVDSLEEWRKFDKIDKMILAGHSMGGYISVAYCERYPQHVDRLILLSPVGVPDPKVEEANRKARGMAPAKNVSLSWRVMRSFFTSLWEWEITPGAMLRTISEERGKNMVSSYVQKRLPAINVADEQTALGDYLYTNALLPPSGEFCLNRILEPVALARKPTVDRIPLLKVPHITFVYGQNDWMDIQGGLDVQKACDTKRQQLQTSNENAGVSPDILHDQHTGRAPGNLPPKVHVHLVKEAGHLLMLDNWHEFNSSVIMAGLGRTYFETRVLKTANGLDLAIPQPDIVTHQDTERLLAERNFSPVRPSSPQKVATDDKSKDSSSSPPPARSLASVDAGSSSSSSDSL
jgi:cardiolipin-specific phospholipase